MHSPAMNHLGIVTIGRNEGERLHRCLTSVVRRGQKVVYVDSNSTDGSVELRRSLGADVVSLDVSRPICVPRARNEGFEQLASWIQISDSFNSSMVTARLSLAGSSKRSVRRGTFGCRARDG